MRFAYIDSQGKEIPIPTVEALQLRIELGAIVESTMFHDANAGRWAPAGEHEIFRTLQRQLSEQEEGFVAPPPSPVTPEPAPPVAAAPPPQPPAKPKADDPLGGLSFDLAPLDEPDEPEEPEPAASAEEPAPDADFDFGSFGALEMEEEPGDAAPEPGPRTPEPPSSPAGGSDLLLETPLAEQDLSDPPGWGGGSLELEQPLSEFTPETPPGWMDQELADEPAGAAPAAERRTPGHDAPPPRREASAGAGAAHGDAAARPPRREPRSRPISRPEDLPAERSSRAGAVALAGVLAVVAGGGWFGWSLFHGGGGEAEATSGYEPVEIPQVAPELETLFAQVAPAALAETVDRMDEIRLAAELPAEPPPDWLAGSYLANASRYPEISAYWQALRQALTEIRTSEETLFREAFDAELAATSLGTDERSRLLDRAAAGFRSALPERDAAYQSLADVFDASLVLHDFLLENEDDIDYEPAAGGISRDPVLEAIPLTQQLGDEMWGRVDDITSALEGIGGLGERVTTDRLFSLLLERLRATPVH